MLGSYHGSESTSADPKRQDLDGVRHQHGGICDAVCQEVKGHKGNGGAGGGSVGLCGPQGRREGPKDEDDQHPDVRRQE